MAWETSEEHGVEGTNQLYLHRRGSGQQFGDNDLDWIKIVEAYSRCKLTYTSDKLVAVNGIMNYMRNEANR